MKADILDSIIPYYVLYKGALQVDPLAKKILQSMYFEQNKQANTNLLYDYSRNHRQLTKFLNATTTILCACKALW